MFTSDLKKFKPTAPGCRHETPPGPGLPQGGDRNNLKGTK